MDRKEKEAITSELKHFLHEGGGGPLRRTKLMELRGLGRSAVLSRESKLKAGSELSIGTGQWTLEPAGLSCPRFQCTQFKCPPSLTVLTEPGSWLWSGARAKQQTAKVITSSSHREQLRSKPLPAQADLLSTPPYKVEREAGNSPTWRSATERQLSCKSWGCALSKLVLL